MWKNININKQNIKQETEKSVLISCPHSSIYDGYSFWHPSKLVRSGRNSYAVSLGYTDDFQFNLKKYGKGKWNKFDVIDEVSISSKEFEKMFGVMDDNISAPMVKDQYETRKPEPVSAEKVEAKEELKDND